MIKTKNNSMHFFKKTVLLAAIFGLAFFLLAKADDIDCSQLTGDDQIKCEILEKKAQNYQDLIDIKNKQQSTLQKQMEIINTEQAITQTELAVTENKAEDLAGKINDLERDINYKEDLVSYQKLMLSGIMQTYYEYYQQGVLDLVLINQNFSEVLSQADYLQQTGAKVNEVLDGIQKAKAELEKQQNDLTRKKEESEKLKQDLEDKKLNLQYNENQKQSLLAQTQGEEQKYQQLLARVEAQKLELFDFSAAGNLEDVIGSVSSYKKPEQKYWDSDNFFSQRDERWANKKIGGTKYLMKDFGCAVTSVAMAYQFKGKNYTPQTVLSGADFTNQALIYWPVGWVKRAFNSVAVDSQLKSGKAVIVHIKKGISAGHFVVIHHKPAGFKSINDYIVHDPYFGSNLYLGTSRALVGQLGTNSGTLIDSMIIY